MSEKVKDKNADDAKERDLDEGLEETFPASDPPAATQPGNGAQESVAPESDEQKRGPKD